MLRGTDYKCCADAACVALVKVPVIFRRMGRRYGILHRLLRTRPRRAQARTSGAFGSKPIPSTYDMRNGLVTRGI
jgi:hypothetical protein